MFGSKKKSIVVQIEGNVNWEFTRDPETDQWFGLCQPLNLHASGETWQELVNYAAESMALLFEDLLADGELGTFLRERGWRTADGLPQPGQKVVFDIPFSVQRRAAGDLIPA